MNEQHLESWGQIGLQQIENSTINIQQYIGHSGEYKALQEREKELVEMLELLPETQAVRREYLTQKLAIHRKLMESFRADVFKLAKTLSEIPLYSENLQKAKTYFEEGRFREAGAVLSVTDLQKEQENLLQDKTRLNDALRNNANAFLVKAQATALDFDNPDRFAQACHYFECSLAADKNFDNLGAYIKFLDENEYEGRALQYCMDAVEMARKIGGDTLSSCLYHLGLVKYAGEEYAETRKLWQEALTIAQQLYETDKARFEPKITFLTGELGRLSYAEKNYLLAEKTFSDLVKLYETLETKHPGMYTAQLLNARYFLLICRSQQNEWAEVESGLNRIREEAQQFAQTDRRWKRFEAFVLYNLSIFLQQWNKAQAAFQQNEQALEICLAEVQRNPEPFLPILAKIYINKGTLLYNGGHPDLSLAAYTEAETILHNWQQRDAGSFLGEYGAALTGTASCLRLLNRDAEAVAKAELALPVLLQMAERNPADYHNRISRVYRILGKGLMQDKQYTKALEAYALCLEYLQKCDQQSESIIKETADCLNDTGYALFYDEQHSEAIVKFEESAALYRPLAEKDPEKYFWSLGLALYNLANYYTYTERDEAKALQYIQEVLNKNKAYGFEKEEKGKVFDLVTDTAVLFLTWKKRRSGELE